MEPPYVLSSAEAATRASVCGYHRRDFDLAVTWSSLDAHASISTSVATTFREPTAGLANLDCLPLELVNTILLQLDLRTLFHFRQINLRARQIVDGLHEYKTITAYALNCIHALLKTGAASHVTLAAAYRCICTETCVICHERYGSLVQLLTCTRCCSVCLTNQAPALCVTSVASISRLLKMPVKSMKGLPSMRTLPGTYTMAERHYTKRVKVISTEAAVIAHRQSEIVELDPETRQRLYETPSLDFMACCALPTYDPAKREIQTGVSCAGCQLAAEESRGCDGLPWELRDTVYSHKGLLRHLEWCESAQLIWISSDGGTARPANLPYFCQMGGYFTPRT